MSDYISREDALLCATGEYADDSFEDSIREIECKKIAKRLKELKPADVRENIRCKDCKFLKVCGDDILPDHMCGNAKSWVVATDLNFGCILAER